METLLRCPNLRPDDHLVEGVLNGVDADPSAQVMMVEQFIAEAQLQLHPTHRTMACPSFDISMSVDMFDDGPRSGRGERWTFQHDLGKPAKIDLAGVQAVKYNPQSGASDVIVLLWHDVASFFD